MQSATRPAPTSIVLHPGHDEIWVGGPSRRQQEQRLDAAPEAIDPIQSMAETIATVVEKIGEARKEHAAQGTGRGSPRWTS